MTAERHGYLGPRGTFCEMALQSWPSSAAVQVPCASVGAALAALRAGELDAAMVPIENSVEGGVSATLDALSVGEDLVIVGEVLVPVTLVLAGPRTPFNERNTRLEAVLFALRMLASYLGGLGEETHGKERKLTSHGC